MARFRHQLSACISGAQSRRAASLLILASATLYRLSLGQKIGLGCYRWIVAGKDIENGVS
ncbi:MAG: hypothetical protein QOF56_2392 [Acidobacteriaceae bacterium]|nr:hypothetical protein [Acidobacteriaceae bacterium]